MFDLIKDFKFSGITEESLRIEEILASPHCYEHGLLWCIRNGATQQIFNQMEYLEFSQDNPVKIEGIERFNKTIYHASLALGMYLNHDGPVSCHLFLSPKDSLSFPFHQDMEDVVIYMVSGGKSFEGVSGEVEMTAGDSIYIPRGVLHRAVNTNSSVMLSFGLERYLEEKL
jgi:mannose-6-phosphate isomerase-like protein (cupin superfamily)